MIAKDLRNYDAAREKYRPDHIKVLFIAEAPPNDPERHFYLEDVRRHDSLFWEMMKVVCDASKIDRPRKPEYLNGFKDGGYFLIDTCETPLKRGIDKKKQLRASLEDLIERSRGLREPGTHAVLICATVYDVCLAPLREAGLNVINTEKIPHPGRGHAPEFRERLSRLLKNE